MPLPNSTSNMFARWNTCHRDDAMVQDESGEPRRMLSITQVLRLVPVTRQSIYRMERSGQFPKSHYVSSHRRLWYADEIAQWQQNLPPQAPRRPKNRHIR